MSVFTLTHPDISTLVALSVQLKDLLATQSLLMWDQETYLPAKGAVTRARQLELLSGIYHDYATSKKIGSLLDRLEDAIQNAPHDFSSYDKALVHEMRRDYTLATKLPKRLVQAISKETSLGLESWRHAREQTNYSIFAPSLQKIIDLKREVADCYGYKESPYDALLDEYEPGLTKAHVMQLFTTLREQLRVLIPQLSQQTAAYDRGILKQSFDQDKLWEFTLHILTRIGFDLERGRQDRSTHPFTMGLHESDVRLTTRLLEGNPISTILSTIHEAGHGMYEQGIDPLISSTTLGITNSLVIHESQSRFWENVIGKSESFWNYLFPQFQARFPNELGAYTATDLYRELNKISPSLIRVDADEITYHMHIILRTEIEADIIEGKCSVNDIPDLWNKKVKDYLGVDVPSDRAGVLQDIHWSQGMIGYFPTYSLGSLLSYQLAEVLTKEHENFDQVIRRGEFEKPRKWLNEKIHKFGRMYTCDQVAQTITGSSLRSDAFLAHLAKKFNQ